MPLSTNNHQSPFQSINMLKHCHCACTSVNLTSRLSAIYRKNQRHGMNHALGQHHYDQCLITNDSLVFTSSPRLFQTEYRDLAYLNNANPFQSNTEMNSTTHFVPLGPMSSSTKHAVSQSLFPLMWSFLPSISSHMNNFKFTVQELSFHNGKHRTFLMEITLKWKNCMSVSKQQPCQFRVAGQQFGESLML
jgi:hypothetical protein